VYRGKVLVVDDDSNVNSMLSDVLSRHGYQIDTATAAEQALDKYRPDAYDVVVSDIKMPGMDGTDLLRKIRAVDRDTSVILVTGFADLNTARDAVRSGAFDYVLKPFNLQELVREVDDAAAETRRQREERDRCATLEVLIEERTRDLDFKRSALELEQERFHGILKSASFGLLVLNGEDNSVILINQQARNYLQIDDAQAGDFFDKDLRELCSGQTGERIEDLITAVKETRKVCSLPPLTTSDGVILEIQSYPVVSQEALRAIVIVVNDITERTKLEEQLLMSSKLAGIGELAAGIAHEINNPIGFVTSNTRTLSRYVADLAELVGAYHKLKEISAAGNACEAMVEQIEVLEEKLDLGYVLDDMQSLVAENRDGLDRVVRILRDLKNFSHADGETPQPLAINTILEDALNLARNEIKYKATVETDFGDVPSILGHPGQLSQVFINILVNAAHAIEDKGTIFITTRANAEMLTVTVRDTGRGIPPDVLPRIFDPFYTTKERGKGTGLGLSIALEIVQKHGGTIAVESEVGQGTSFTVELPVNQTTAPTV